MPFPPALAVAAAAAPVVVEGEVLEVRVADQRPQVRRVRVERALVELLRPQAVEPAVREEVRVSEQQRGVIRCGGEPPPDATLCAAF